MYALFGIVCRQSTLVLNVNDNSDDDDDETDTERKMDGRRKGVKSALYRMTRLNTQKSALIWKYFYAKKYPF